MSNGWDKVKKDNPCKICGRPDWCLVAKDGTAAICARISDGSVKKVGNEDAGWLHKLSDNPVPVKYRPKPKKAKTKPVQDFFKLMEECRDALTYPMSQDLANQLGVSHEALWQLQVGYGKFYGQWWQTFPLRDGNRKTVGIRLRSKTGKCSVTGSKNALFWPVGVKADSDNLLFICEGPTDCAALLDLGFDAIGRSSCGTGLEYIKTMIGHFNRRVVIMADKDEAKKRPDGSVFYPGIDGAIRLGKALKSITASVRVIKPAHYKDVRLWYQNGATAETVMCLVENTRFV